MLGLAAEPSALTPTLSRKREREPLPLLFMSPLPLAGEGGARTTSVVWEGEGNVTGTAVLIRQVLAQRSMPAC